MQVSDDTMKIIDKVADYVAPNFTFGYHDVDDIKQEIRIISLQAMEKYDGERSLFNYLVTVVKRRLINLKREQLYRPDAFKDTCDTIEDMRREVRNLTKKGIMEPDLFEDNFLVSQDRDICEFITKRELVQLLKKHLKPPHRKYLNFILSGNFVPIKHRIPLMEEIKKILDQYYKEGDWE